MTAAAEIAARLDRAPVTAFHRRLAVAVGAGLFVDGFDVYLGSAVSAALLRDHVAALATIGALAGITVLGLAIGGLGAGILADRVGRRITLRWTLAFVIVGSLGAAVAPTVAVLIFCRFVAALGLGGEPVIGYAMLGEFLTPRRRGYWLGWIGLAANVGMPLALLLGAWILPAANGWRWMLALPAAAAIPVVFLRRNLPESPRWLATRGRDAEARRIVAALEATVPGGLPPLPPLPPPPAAGRDAAAPGLLAADNRARLLVACAINVGILSAVFGFVVWLPTFLASAGHSIAASSLFAGLIALGNPSGVLLALLVIERIERKWSYVAAILATILFGGGYAVARSDPAILALGFLVVTAIYFAGTIGLTAYVPELFPIRHRMRGIGIASGVGRMVAMLLPLVIVPTLKTSGQTGVVLIVLAILFVQGLIVARFGIRSNGRSLEAI